MKETGLTVEWTDTRRGEVSRRHKHGESEKVKEIIYFLRFSLAEICDSSDKALNN